MSERHQPTVYQVFAHRIRTVLFDELQWTPAAISYEDFEHVALKVIARFCAGCSLEFEFIRLAVQVVDLADIILDVYTTPCA